MKLYTSKFLGVCLVLGAVLTMARTGSQRLTLKTMRHGRDWIVANALTAKAAAQYLMEPEPANVPAPPPPLTMAGTNVAQNTWPAAVLPSSLTNATSGIVSNGPFARRVVSVMPG